MSGHAWGHLNGAKVVLGVVLALVVAPVVDVLARHWPTGGAR